MKMELLFEIEIVLGVYDTAMVSVYKMPLEVTVTIAGEIVYCSKDSVKLYSLSDALYHALIIANTYSDQFEIHDYS